MSPRRRIYPVSSFGPEVMAALLKGATREFRVGPMPYRDAVKFHFRIHSLRAAMRAEQHSQYPIVARAKISLAWGERIGKPQPEERISSRNVRSPKDPLTPTILTIAPHDSEFAEHLLRAGIKPEELREDPLARFPASSPAERANEPDYLDQVLSNIERKKKPI